MKENQENSQKGGGIGPIILISAVLIGIVILLKFIIG
jgi:hypothetical protein